MNVLSIILGVILIVGGMYCLLTPIATFATLGWLIGLSMVLEGFGTILAWNERRKMGLAGTWTLIGAIFSTLMGAIILSNSVVQLGIDAFLTNLVALWLIGGGIMRILASFAVRDAHKNGSATGSNWWMLLLAGILMTIVGVFGLFHPMLTAMSVGTLMGISIISSGMGLIMGTFTR